DLEVDVCPRPQYLVFQPQYHATRGYGSLRQVDPNRVVVVDLLLRVRERLLRRLEPLRLHPEVLTGRHLRTTLQVAGHDLRDAALLEGTLPAGAALVHLH